MTKEEAVKQVKQENKIRLYNIATKSYREYMMLKKVFGATHPKTIFAFNNYKSFKKSFEK